MARYLHFTDDYFKRTEARSVPNAFYDSDARAWAVDLDSLDGLGKMVLTRLFPETAEHVDWDGDTHGVLRPYDYTDMVDMSPAFNTWDVLHDYQKRDLNYLAHMLQTAGGGYLAWDRGLGKTLGTLVLADVLGATRNVIVAPASAKDLVWRAEIKKWLGTDAEVYNVEGNDSKRKARVAGWAMSEAPTSWLLIHYEALRLLPPGLKCDLMAVDESHRLAKGAARGNKVPKFYKALMKWVPKYRLALSGSVINNDIEDMFGALHFILPENYKSKYRDWSDRFVLYVPGTYSARVPVGIKPEKADELAKELGTLMVTRRKEDELDLPELIEQTVRVDLSPTQRKVYEDLARDFVAKIPGTGDVIVADGQLAAMSKLCQVATGLDLQGKVRDSTKLDFVADLVHDAAPGKTVVFTWHREAAKRAVEYIRGMGHEAVAITGDTKSSERELRMDFFRDDPDCVALCATIKLLGESVNLQFADHVVFVEQSWVPTDMHQARDRVYRQGQDKRVTVTYIEANDTIDTIRVAPTLRSKGALLDMLLGKETH